MSDDNRPTTPTESLKQSLIEMKLIRQGKAKGKTWRELRNELKRGGGRGQI